MDNLELKTEYEFQVRCGYDGGWGKWSEKMSLNLNEMYELEISDLVKLLKDNFNEKAICAKTLKQLTDKTEDDGTNKTNNEQPNNKKNK